MAAIKHTLQREVFLPCEERLIAVVHVTKPGKKKKASFLCAAVTTEKPIQAVVCQVKKADRSDTFKKKRWWNIRDIKSVDARCINNKDTADFEMNMERQYKWVASSITEKNSFIQCLFKLSQRYVVQKPEFSNLPAGILEAAKGASEADRSVDQVEELASAAEWEYHALTDKEETDLSNLMANCDFAISNAEAFAEQLSRDLSVLDGANVHSIMGSEEQVLELMVLLDHGLQEAIAIEEKLDEYSDKLQSVKDLMEIMKDKDSLIQVRNGNHAKLLDELDRMITSLDFAPGHVSALVQADLCKPKGIQECTTAANVLLACVNAEIHPSLQHMSAVQEQQKKFAKYTATFAKRLAIFLNSLFIQQGQVGTIRRGNELGETLSRHASELRLPKHHSSHRDLIPYADLMLWLKQVDKASYYNKLAKVYQESISKLYDREIKEFMECAKSKLAPAKGIAFGRDPTNWFVPTPQKGHSHSSHHGSSGSLNRGTLDRKSTKSRDSLSTLDSDAGSARGSDPDVSGRLKFDQMLEHVLSELGPVCLAEQDFCVKFFYLVAEDQQMETDVDGFTPQKPDTSKQSFRRKQLFGPKRKINEEVRQMMKEIFPALEPELINFIQYGDKLDNFNSLYMLVRMTQHVMSAEDTGSFLNKTYGNCLIYIRRNFDHFIKNQIMSIHEYRPPKKSKVGIIPFVHNFQEFAVTAESIFKGSDRRMELNKAYVELINTMFVEIQRIGNESTKIPREVVLFENYHHIYAMLSQLKISCLDNQRKEARQKYQDHLQNYVTSHLGRPMEKLSVFFEGIQAKVAGGVKMEEVGYQLAYSKQELRKVIKEYPGKEVKKGLEHLVKKVEKHLCEEENLLQVVWHSMQDEFLKQYRHFEELIHKCYPDSGITLDFTIDNLLEYFSDIAQQH